MLLIVRHDDDKIYLYYEEMGKCVTVEKSKENIKKLRNLFGLHRVAYENTKAVVYSQ